MADARHPTLAEHPPASGAHMFEMPQGVFEMPQGAFEMPHWECRPAPEAVCHPPDCQPSRKSLPCGGGLYAYSLPTRGRDRCSHADPHLRRVHPSVPRQPRLQPRVARPSTRELVWHSMSHLAWMTDSIAVFLHHSISLHGHAHTHPHARLRREGCSPASLEKRILASRAIRSRGLRLA